MQLVGAMKRIGFYPGSFDPVTLGHTDVIARACRLVDTLVIGVGVHDAKQPLFAADERIAMLQAEVKPIADHMAWAPAAAFVYGDGIGRCSIGEARTMRAPCNSSAP